MAGGPIVKTCRDLTLILIENEFDIPVTATEILELLDLDEEKFELAISLLNKIKTNIKIQKCSFTQHGMVQSRNSMGIQIHAKYCFGLDRQCLWRDWSL